MGFRSIFSKFNKAIKETDDDITPISWFEKILKLMGIHFPKEKKDKIHIRSRFFLFLGILVIIFLFSVVVLFALSTHPSFCNTCHIMKPYYKAWKTSSHNFVPCVECHYPPDKRGLIWAKFQASAQVVKYITQTYGAKPYAEIDDASCLRKGCHDKRLLEGEVKFKRGIIFDHKPHLVDLRRGKQLRCTSCHSQIVIGTHITVTENTCFLCHFKGTKHGRVENPLGGCPSCHLPPAGDIKVGNTVFNHKDFVGTRHTPCQKCHLDAVQGDGEAPKEHCFQCHNQPEKLAKYEDVTFMHENHVAKRKIECSRCHLEIKHAVRTTVKPLEYSCDVCHESKHGGQKEMYMGVGGKGFPTVPSHMFEAQVDCIACHVKPKEAGARMRFAGQTYAASESACVDCHGKTFEGMLQTWNESFVKMIAEIKPKIDALQKALKDEKNNPAFKQADKLYADAMYNIDFVSVGRGVHNVFYAAGLLQVADKSIDKAMELLKKTPIKMQKGTLSGGDYCAYLCHDRVGVKVPITVKFEGTSFQHLKHFTDLRANCTDCHSAQKHKEVVVKKADCMKCHHSADNNKCSTCHGLQRDFYSGNIKIPIIKDKISNIMEDKVDCTGCHDWNHRHSRNAVLQKCLQCHEKSYTEIFDGWIKNIDNLNKKGEEAIRRLSNNIGQQKKLGKNVKELEKEFNELRNNYSIIRRANGIHNPELYETTIDNFIKEIHKFIPEVQ